MTRTNYLLWAIYIALLLVLLPHTAWTFGQFEPSGWDWLGWIAAFAFEAAIAAFTWRLKGLIESTPNYRAGKVWLRRLKYRYANPYGMGLLVTLAVSGLANWAHAVEFGQAFRVFADYSIPPAMFSVAFGAALPAISLLFARVLAETQDTEQEANQELVEAKQNIKELRKQVREVEADRIAAEGRANEAEQRFTAAEDLFASLFAAAKRERILAVHQRWPALPPSAIAVITEASPSHVSGVLKEIEAEGEEI